MKYPIERKENKHDNELFYFPDLGIDGTIPELVRWANDYTDDYSDAALAKISEIAKERGYGVWEVESPKLLIEERARKEGFPYERMKLDLMESGIVSFSETIQREDGWDEVEIWRDRDYIIVSIQGNDDGTFFTAASKWPLDLFMDGDKDWLERQVSETLFYGKEYDLEENGRE